MRNRSYVMLVLLMLAFLLTGCANKTIQQSTSSGDVRQVDGVMLPEWAPQNPSPEFLRAAKVLKPAPPETLESFTKDQPLAVKSVLSRYNTTFPAAYEFFGSLSDEQIKRFQSTKEVRISSKQLTSAQHSALNKWFEAFRKVAEGAPEDFRDYLVMLYKYGAAEDLSNVDVGFTAKPGMGAGHQVHICFWIKQTDGTVEHVGTYIAEI